MKCEEKKSTQTNGNLKPFQQKNKMVYIGTPNFSELLPLFFHSYQLKKQNFEEKWNFKKKKLDKKFFILEFKELKTVRSIKIFIENIIFLKRVYYSCFVQFSDGLDHF